MPLIKKEQLDAQFKEENFSNLYLIFGDEPYLKEYYVNKLQKKLVNPDFKDFNFHTHGKSSTLDDIFMDASMLPMMGEYTFVLVCDFPVKLKENYEALKDYLADIPENAVIVFWCDSYEVTEKDSQIVKLFSKYGCAVNLEKRSTEDLVKLIISEAKKYNCTVNRADASYLVNTVGSDIYTLKNELGKICNFKKGGEITQKDIDELAVKSLQARVFDLSKLIMNKKSDAAFALLNDLFYQQENASRILVILASSYIDVYRVMTARRAGVPGSEVVDLFGYGKNKSFLITSYASRNASRFSVTGIRAALDLISDAEIKMKSTSVDDNLILEETVAKLLITETK